MIILDYLGVITRVLINRRGRWENHTQRRRYEGWKQRLECCDYLPRYRRGLEDGRGSLTTERTWPLEAGKDNNRRILS